MTGTLRKVRDSEWSWFSEDGTVNAGLLRSGIERSVRRKECG